MLKQIDKSLLIKFLQSDPTLCQYGLSQDAQRLVDIGEWAIPEDSFVLGYYVDEELASVIHLEKFNTTTLIVHWYCASKFWGTGLTDTVVSDTEEWARENTDFICAMMYVPTCCTVTLKAIQRQGFKPVGVIPMGVWWRDDQLEDMILMHKIIIEGEN